ncbi:MAG: TnpV protein [Clostridia bacterium]|nr:TnpV protein [Clostridia bacterium]
MQTEVKPMTLTYRMQDGVRIPNLELPVQTNYSIGKYGQMRLSFMKQHRKGTYTTILTEGRLNSYLHEIDETAKAQISEIISRMAQNLGVTEQMKSENQMKWVQMMNSIKVSAEEEVLTSLIYA